MPERMAVLRVNADGIILAADAEAQRWLGACAGRSCQQVVHARGRDDSPICSRGCASEVACEAAGPREEAGVVVRGSLARLSCLKVGDETVVMVRGTERVARCYPNPLSERERTVLEHIATGYTNPEIAGLLKISPGTVRTYVERLFDKLGATSRAEAVAAARDLGELG